MDKHYFKKDTLAEFLALCKKESSEYILCVVNSENINDIQSMNITKGSAESKIAMLSTAIDTVSQTTGMTHEEVLKNVVNALLLMKLFHAEGEEQHE